MKRKIIAACIILLALAIIAYMSFDKIALFTLSKFYNTDVSYKSFSKNSQDGYEFEDLRVMNRRVGVGLFSSKAFFRPVKKIDFWRALEYDFKFKDVHFIKQKKEALKDSYGRPEDIVIMPFEGRWKYKEMTGSVEIFSNGITLKKFLASGNQIKLFISGDIF